METIFLIFGSALVGFVFGALVYRNNLKKAEDALKKAQEKIGNFMGEIKK